MTVATRPKRLELLRRSTATAAAMAELRQGIPTAAQGDLAYQRIGCGCGYEGRIEQREAKL